MKVNFRNLSMFVILLIVEIGIGIYVHDKIIRPFIGDILVVGVVYFFVRSFTGKFRLLPFYVFVFACSVEFAQYLNIISILQLENFKIAKVILGATFDFMDIFCYFIGTLLIYLYEILSNYLGKHKNS